MAGQKTTVYCCKYQPHFLQIVSKSRTIGSDEGMNMTNVLATMVAPVRVISLKALF